MTEDPTFPPFFYTGILETCPPLSLGSGNRLRELRDGCGKGSPGCWGFQRPELPRRTTAGKMSPASFGKMRPIGLRTPFSVISSFTRSLLLSLTPLKVIALRAELEGHVGSLGARWSRFLMIVLKGPFIGYFSHHPCILRPFPMRKRSARTPWGFVGGRLCAPASDGAPRS